MFKKLSAVILAVLMLSLTACGQKLNPESIPETTDDGQTVSNSAAKILNPLTGVSGISKEAAESRPVAIMVNNMKTAQSVQTGLTDADIIYETEVEGGITRLMAVFQDVSGVSLIGTVRSARYPYIDLAGGHNAVYVHEGQDPTYAKGHLSAIDDISLENAKLGKRISNGLAREHTLYTEGPVLWNGIKSKFKTENTNASPWVDFAAEDEEVTLPSGSAQSVSVPFSASYNTGFTYDSSTKTYTRLSGGSVWHEYKTGKSLAVKNVFVLLTTISDYPDGKHRKVALDSGDGYYITNGTYTFIKWSKGSVKNGFTFTDTEGNPLKVSVGNSYVCIADKRTSNPTIQ